MASAWANHLDDPDSGVDSAKDSAATSPTSQRGANTSAWNGSESLRSAWSKSSIASARSELSDVQKSDSEEWPGLPSPASKGMLEKSLNNSTALGKRKEESNRSLELVDNKRPRTSHDDSNGVNGEAVDSEGANHTNGVENASSDHHEDEENGVESPAKNLEQSDENGLLEGRAGDDESESAPVEEDEDSLSAISSIVDEPATPCRKSFQDDIVALRDGSSGDGRAHTEEADEKSVGCLVDGESDGNSTIVDGARSGEEEKLLENSGPPVDAESDVENVTSGEQVDDHAEEPPVFKEGSEEQLPKSSLHTEPLDDRTPTEVSAVEENEVDAVGLNVVAELDEKDGSVGDTSAIGTDGISGKVLHEVTSTEPHSRVAKGDACKEEDDGEHHEVVDSPVVKVRSLNECEEEPGRPAAELSNDSSSDSPVLKDERSSADVSRIESDDEDSDDSEKKPEERGVDSSVIVQDVQGSEMREKVPAPPRKHEESSTGSEASPEGMEVSGDCSGVAGSEDVAAQIPVDDVDDTRDDPVKIARRDVDSSGVLNEVESSEQLDKVPSATRHEERSTDSEVSTLVARPDVVELAFVVARTIPSVNSEVLRDSESEDATKRYGSEEDSVEEVLCKLEKKWENEDGGQRFEIFSITSEISDPSKSDESTLHASSISVADEGAVDEASAGGDEVRAVDSAKSVDVVVPIPGRAEELDQAAPSSTPSNDAVGWDSNETLIDMPTAIRMGRVSPGVHPTVGSRDSDGGPVNHPAEMKPDSFVGAKAMEHDAFENVSGKKVVVRISSAVKDTDSVDETAVENVMTDSNNVPSGSEDAPADPASQGIEIVNGGPQLPDQIEVPSSQGSVSSSNNASASSEEVLFERPVSVLVIQQNEKERKKDRAVTFRDELSFIEPPDASWTSGSAKMDETEASDGSSFEHTAMNTTQMQEHFVEQLTAALEEEQEANRESEGREQEPEVSSSQVESVEVSCLDRSEVEVVRLQTFTGYERKLEISEVDVDCDEEEIEDETLYERLVGLTEMFPESFLDRTKKVALWSASALKGLYSVGRTATWVVCSSSLILFAPLIIEIERVRILEAQREHQAQMLLGPSAARGAAGGMVPPMGMTFPPQPPAP